MAHWNKNETVANKRATSLFVYQADGITPAGTGTQFQALKATLAMSYATGNLSGMVWTLVTAGASGNSVTLTTTADGAGAGSLTNSGSNYTFHFATGVTTINNMITALAALATPGGTYTGTNTLAAGDATSSHSFSGGQDSVVFVRSSGGSWATAAGTLTNTGVVGNFEYVATQAETNVDASEIEVRIGTGATFAIGATSYNTVINVVEMRDGTLNQLGEGSNTYGDLIRLLVGICAGQVSDFTTTGLVFKSLDTTKTRATYTDSATGRGSPTLGDLSGP